jgi:hypothetical protein
MRRKILSTIFQLLAIASIILSLKPRLDLLFYEYGPESHYNAYAHTYWNYFIIRSWLIVLIGLGLGLVLFWISSRISPKSPRKATRFAVGRLAILVCSAIAIILLCVYLPGLSGIFGRNALDNQVPMEVSPRPASGLVFMVMTNELTAPRIEYEPPSNTTNYHL